MSRTRRQGGGAIDFSNRGAADQPLSSLSPREWRELMAMLGWEAG